MTLLRTAVFSSIHVAAFHPPFQLHYRGCYLLVPRFRKTEHAPSRSFLSPLSLSRVSLSTVSLSSRIHRAISDFLDPRGFGEGGEGGTCGIEAGEGNRRTKPRWDESPCMQTFFSPILISFSPFVLAEVICMRFRNPAIWSVDLGRGHWKLQISDPQLLLRRTPPSSFPTSGHRRHLPVADRANSLPGHRCPCWLRPRRSCRSGKTSWVENLRCSIFNSLF